jgi:DNA-binding CsgD family transcriptional regulator
VKSAAPTRAQDPFARLSGKEREVLTAVLTVGSIPRAAKRLFVSTNTVKSQLRSIYRKTGVTSKAGLSDLAARHGLHPGPADWRHNTTHSGSHHA